ncbi:MULTISPECIES: protein kinase [unclassified Streptomyces]|uniref:protein kinase domain-containing protein n=2 Tax=Streptomyces TaxID=1883 RepID=UPI000C06B3D0|nr:protein kinase [Streptomyces sp. LamerLS-316]MYQ42426.1 protein kinase [Streptomyces sp. SID4921]
MINSDGQQVVAERYVLTERLGSGGMGTVWSAWDHLLQRTVAVKELHVVAHGDEYRLLMRRVLTEARAIARVSHPHVIDIYDLVQFDTRLWIVMELVHGGSLAEHLQTRGPLPPADVARVGLEVLSALEAVHAAGALHRDVKPANILLRSDGSAVLTDFGIAALADGGAHTSTGGVVGSVDFMAPERLRGLTAGPPSDLFSLGGTLCALATGTPPFARPAATAVMHAAVYEAPHIALDAGQLRDTIEGLLCKDPADRPHADAVERGLRAVTERGDVPLRPTRRQRGVPAPRRRIPAWAVAVAVLAVLGGVGAGIHGLSGSAHVAASERPSAEDGTRRVDAVMPVPGRDDRFWVFAGSEYVLVEVGDSPADARRVSGPGALGDWKKSFGGVPSFTEKIDAVMRVPGHEDRFWVFSGDEYVVVEAAEGSSARGRLQGPGPLTDWSNSFASLSGFEDRVDAVMPVPGRDDRFWVFAGSEYVLVEVGDSPADARRVSGPGALGDWKKSFGGVPSFTEKIDAVMRVPGHEDRFWVFSGDEYVVVEAAEGSSARGRLQGPGPLTDWAPLDELLGEGADA